MMMAQPAADEVASSPQVAAADSTLDGAPGVVTPADGSAARTSPSVSMPVTSGFNAINSPVVPENDRPAPPADVANQLDGASDLTPPHNDAAVPQTSAPPAPISVSEPADPPSALQDDNSNKNTNGADAAPTGATSAEDAMADNAYGTRSRNRTNTRPNYAEDQDDFELPSAATANSSKKKPSDAAPPSNQTAKEPKRAQESASFVAINSNAPNGTSSGSKDTIPGTSSFATQNHQQTSKKRKATAPAPASTTSQAATASNAQPPVAQRRPGASIPSAAVRETNLMTFTKHKHCLNKKGELVADDGTRLNVNGRQSFSLLYRVT